LPLPCDPSIHSATVAIRRHIRERLRRLFQLVPAPLPRSEGFEAFSMAASRARGARKGDQNAIPRKKAAK
jgi:hypothetical protein